MLGDTLPIVDGLTRTIFIVAWATFAVLVVGLLAAAAGAFFSSIVRFDDELREATMDLSPSARRRFYALYDGRRPKSPAVAWCLAVAFGPAGANLYLEQWAACAVAVISLNGLGVWWFESWFSTPRLVIIKNRRIIAWVEATMQMESSR